MRYAYAPKLLPLLAVIAVTGGLCPGAENPPVGRKSGGQPASADLCNETGTVQYSASWAAGTVTLRAKGTHHTGGYQVSFRQSPIEIFPPQFSLAHKRPEGIVTQAITPFTASTTFAAAQKPKEITVHDAKGQRRVPVQ